MDPITMSQDLATEVLNTNAQFVNHIFSFITPLSLKCAAQLGIADAIANNKKPMTLSELSTALHLPPQKAVFLPQLMRILTHSGYFNDDEISGHYSLTSTSQLLLENHPFTMKPLLLFILDPLLLNPWIGLGEWFRNKDQHTAFESSNGAAIWECTGARPEFNKLMNDSMAADSKMVGSVLMSNPRAREVFQGMDTMVDVGGGVGEMAKAISKAFPHLKCMVLDLPHVVEGLQETHNLTFVAGDMFNLIPPANSVLLKWILHDWSDEDSVKILKQCKKAITSEGCSEAERKVVIIDVVIDEDQINDKEDYKKRETQLYYDMEMMAIVGGKERTKKEWEKLFLDAGFQGGFKIFSLLGFRSLIQLFP